MPRAKSRRFTESAQALAAPESPVLLVTIEHALLAEPLRFVNDTEDLVSNGHNYRACSFGWTWPDDQDKQTPRASISIANTDRSISPFFERTHGARGAVLTLTQVMRSAPDFVEDQVTLDLTNIVATAQAVTGQLGFDEILNKASTPYTYRPETAPGLF